MPVVSTPNATSGSLPEQRRDDGRPQRRAELLVEIVFQCERPLPRRGVTGIQWRLGIALFERRDDTRRIADRPSLQEQDRQRTAPRRAPGADQVVGAKYATAVRDPLVVERPADLLAEMRERDVPQQRRVHGGKPSTRRSSA
jgi:hypothetical protein